MHHGKHPVVPRCHRPRTWRLPGTCPREMVRALARMLFEEPQRIEIGVIGRGGPAEIKEVCSHCEWTFTATTTRKKKEKKLSGRNRK